jgi:hypothetical protein
MGDTIPAPAPSGGLASVEYVRQRMGGCSLDAAYRLLRERKVAGTARVGRKVYVVVEVFDGWIRAGCPPAKEFERGLGWHSPIPDPAPLSRSRSRPKKRS